jgi:hypothetical protein
MALRADGMTIPKFVLLGFSCFSSQKFFLIRP